MISKLPIHSDSGKSKILLQIYEKIMNFRSILSKEFYLGMSMIHNVKKEFETRCHPKNLVSFFSRVLKSISTIRFSSLLFVCLFRMHKTRRRPMAFMIIKELSSASFSVHHHADSNIIYNMVVLL